MLASGAPQTVSIDLTDATATRLFGNDLALSLRPGWLVFLRGDLGAGKTEIARAIIRCLSDNPVETVPSPTFSLVQEYQVVHGGKDITVLHGDLYRIGDESEIAETGLDQPDGDAVRIIEWAELAKGTLGEPDLDLLLENRGENGRKLTVSGSPDAMAILRRSLVIRHFLRAAWGENVERQKLAGDASSRAYEIVRREGEQRILMNAPKQPDGPPIQDGKPYSQIAHLAEDVARFDRTASMLERMGLAVPQVFGRDHDAGLLLIEDLGRGTIIDADGNPVRKRYLAAVEALAAFHDRSITEEDRSWLFRYDRDALRIEAALLVDWYAPRMRSRALKQDERDAFFGIWDDLFEKLAVCETRFVLRDYHSPNIIWRSEYSGAQRVGIIDFQDGLMGPSAYDVASLAQDARVDMPDTLEQAIVGHYVSLRQKTFPGFDVSAFNEQYAIMAAQRATKILGIFVRLDQRDGKSAYLNHLPRIAGYLRRSLRHPVLSQYRKWLETVIEM